LEEGVSEGEKGTGTSKIEKKCRGGGGSQRRTEQRSLGKDSPGGICSIENGGGSCGAKGLRPSTSSEILRRNLRGPGGPVKQGESKGEGASKKKHNCKKGSDNLNSLALCKRDRQWEGFVGWGKTQVKREIALDLPRAGEGKLRERGGRTKRDQNVKRSHSLHVGARSVRKGGELRKAGGGQNGAAGRLILG